MKTTNEIIREINLNLNQKFKIDTNFVGKAGDTAELVYLKIGFKGANQVLFTFEGDKYKPLKCENCDEVMEEEPVCLNCGD